MKCWNCQSALDEALLCARCGMPQPTEFLGAFEVLGLAPRLNWDAAELQRSYEQLAQKCHPDLFWAHMDERVLTAARRAMRTLNDAYRELRDPIGRLRYVLAATGHSRELTRTVPDGLQESAQIVDRVLRTVEKARSSADRETWEAHQDHLASLQVQVEKAQEHSESVRAGLVVEWDNAVGNAPMAWPQVSDGWYEQAIRWLGEREYLDALTTRMHTGRDWQEVSEAGSVK
ncbi:MAG: DnaJ domain-containing protein [Candidatus Eisenbacteria sp.]|nr:DnaJ domain-containing protein [Candidatus Eisenbacteria bacterium]